MSKEIICIECDGEGTTENLLTGKTVVCPCCEGVGVYEEI
jgi:hypothetical protein